MKRLIILCLLLITLYNASAEQSVPPPALPYLDILLKRPQPGTVFDRFYSAWLEESTAEALRDFLTARASDPAATPAYHLVLAIFQVRQGEDEAALLSYDRALQLGPDNAGAWVERSRVEARALDFNAALASLDRAEAAKPNGALALEIGKLKGSALLRLGRNEEAVRTWKDLAAAHADDEGLMEDLIDLLVEEGQYETAVESADELLRRSRDPVAKVMRLFRLADILMLAERREDALRTLSEALSASGADSWIEGDALSRIHQAFRMSDDVEGLLQYLENLVEKHPQRVALGWQHVQLLAETGRKDAALLRARSLLQSNPGRRDLREGFLDLLETLDMLKEAVGQARLAVAQNPVDKELLFRLALLCHRTGDTLSARATLEQFLAAPEAGEGDYLRVARLLESWEPPVVPENDKAQAKNTAATEVYARLMEKFPGSVGAREAQARHLLRAGRRDEALAIWRRLAQTGTVEDLLRIGQTLQSSLESRAALEALSSREGDFATEPRFLGLLAQAAAACKEPERALPPARARLHCMKDAEGIEAAVKDLLGILRGGENPLSALALPLMEELRGHSRLSIQDRCLLAALLQADGAPDEAEKTLADAPEEDGMIAFSQLARMHQARQDWLKAAEALQRVAELPGARSPALAQRLADLFRRAEKPDLALAWIAEWKKRSPGAVQPWVDEARLLADLDRPLECLTLLRTAMRKFPGNLEVASACATACLENGRAEEAEGIYLSLYEKTTDAASRLSLLGPLASAAQSRGGMQRILDLFQQRQRQNRASAQPWLALAELHRAAGNDQERRRCLHEAARLRPQDLDLLLAIARSEEDAGLTPEALRTLEAAAKLDKTTQTRERIARLQIESGDADLGYRMLFELAGGSQTSARNCEQLADAMAATGEWERVVAFLEQVLPNHPGDHRLQYLNAVALEEAGREREAVSGFLQLLTLEDPRGAPSPSRIVLPASLQLPIGAEEWLHLPGMMHAAYVHRQKVAQGLFPNPFRGHHGVMGGHVGQATDATQTRLLALAHLLQIAIGWNAMDRAALVPLMQQAGITHGGLLLEAFEESPQLVVTPEMLAAHPQDAALHAVWLMQGRLVRQDEEFASGYDNAWKIFQNTHPSLALLCARNAWAISGEQSAAWAQRSAGLIEAMPKPDAPTFHSIAAHLHSLAAPPAGEIHAPRPDARSIEQIANRLKEWYRTRAPSDGYRADHLLGALVAAQDWPGVVEVVRLNLSHSLATKGFNSTPATRRALPHFSSGRTALVPQPIEALPGLPEDLALFVCHRAGMNFEQADTHGADEVPEVINQLNRSMRDGLRPFLEQADDTGLRRVLQILCGEEEALEKELAAFLQSEEATANDFLTAGWLAQRRNHLTGAIAHYTRALALSKDEEARQVIENAIFYEATRYIHGGNDETKREALRAQMKAMLETHLQQAKTQNEKQHVASMMVQIGLEEEGRAILEAVRAAQSRTSQPARRNTPAAVSYSGGSAHSRRQPQRPNTPEEFMREGRRDLAVKEFARQFRAAIQMTLLPHSGARGHQQLHQAMDAAVKLKLWDDAAKVLRDAAESGGWRARQEFAVMMEHVGTDFSPALTEHRSVVSMNPRAYASHLRLAVVLSYEGKYGEAVQHWQKLPAMLQEQFLPAVAEEFTTEHQYSVPAPEALSGLLCAWLKGLDAKRPLSPNLVRQFQQTLQRIAGAEGVALYQSSKSDLLDGGEVLRRLKPAGTPELREAAARRRAAFRKAHDDLCRAMLAVPELARLAFPALAGLALEDGDAAAAQELEATAVNLLTHLDQAQVKRRLAISLSGQIDHGSPFRSGGNISRPDAAFFLVRAAALRRDIRALDETIFPLIYRTEDRERAQWLKGYAGLLMVGEEGFVTAAENWLKRRPRGSGDESCRIEVLRLWLDRNFSVSLDSLYTPARPGVHGPVSQAAAAAYVAALGHRNPEGMRQFTRKLRDQWIGPDAETRRRDVSDFIAAEHLRSNRSWHLQPSAKERALRDYGNWLQERLLEPGGLHLLEIAREDGFDRSPEWLHRVATHDHGKGRVDSPEVFLQTARMAGFLKDAAEFRAFDLSGSEGRPLTWLECLARQFRERASNEQMLSALELLGKEPPTLGTDIMQALLSGHRMTPLWLDGKAVALTPEQVARFPSDDGEDRARRSAALEIMLARHAADFAAMPAAARGELAVLLRNELQGYPRPDRLGKELTLVLAPLLQTENAEMLRRVDAVLAAKTWDDLRQQEDSLAERFRDLLSHVALIDLAKTEAAVRRSVELLRSSPEQKQAVERNYGETPVSRFLHDLGKTPPLWPVMFELAETDGLTRAPSWRSNLRNQLAGMAYRSDSVLELFTQTPFVAEAAAFRDLPNPDTVPTLLASLINTVEHYEGRVEAVHGHLEKQPATFGRDLLLALFHPEPGKIRSASSFYGSKRPDDAALLAFIQKRSPDFAKLRPETASCLLALLEARLPGLKTKAALDSALQIALQPLVEIDQAHFEASVALWMQTRNLRDICISTDDIIQDCERLLDRLAQSDKGRALAFLDHVGDLLDESQRVSANLGHVAALVPAHATLHARWLQSAIRAPELFCEVRQRAEKTGAAKDSGWLNQLLREAAQISRLRGQPARLITFLENCGMLNPAATFEPVLLPVPDASGPATMLELIISDLSSHREAVKALQERQPRVFGAEFLLLHLSSHAEKREAFAQAYAEEITCSPPERQRLLAGLIMRRKWVGSFFSSLPTFQGEFAENLRQQATDSVRAIEELLKVQNIEDVAKLRAAETLDYLQTHLIVLSLAEPEKARQGILHLSNLYSQQTQGSRWGMHQFLRNLCAIPCLVPAAFHFVAQNESKASLFGKDWSEYALIRKALPDSTIESPGKLADALKDLGLLTGPATFDAVALPGFATRSLLELVNWRLERAPADVREEAARLLLESKDPAFGHHLFAALIAPAHSPWKKQGLDLCSAGFPQVRTQAAGAILKAFEGDYPSLQTAKDAVGDLTPFAPLLETRAIEERSYLDGVLSSTAIMAPPYRGRAPAVARELARLMKLGQREDALRLVQAMLPQLEPKDRGPKDPNPKDPNPVNPARSVHQRDGEHLSNFLSTMLFDDGLASAPALFACLMRSAAQFPEVKVLPDSMNPEGLYPAGTLLFHIWERRGGWAAPALVFDQLMREIAIHGIEQTRGLWLPLLHHGLVLMGPLEREQLFEWSARQNLPALRLVADEMRLAQSLLEVTSPLLPPPGARIPDWENAGKRTQIEAVSRAAAEFLSDEGLATHIRLALAAWFSAIFPGVLDEETRQTWGLAAARAWKEGKPITRFEIESLLNSASVLPMNETWHQTCALVLEHWNSQPYEPGKRYNRRGFHPFMLRFSARFGLARTLDRLVKEDHEVDPERFNGILLEAGGWKAASRVNLHTWRAVWHSDSQWKWWLPPSEAALAEMHAAGEVALFAQALALNSDDTITRILYPGAKGPSREERLASFARRLAALPLPADASERVPALVLLGRENPAAALALLPQYDAIAESLQPLTLGKFNGRRWWLDFLGVHAALKIAKGDYSLAEKSWNLVKIDDPSVSPMEAMSAVDRFHGTLSRCLMNCWAAGLARDPDKLLQLGVFAEQPRFKFYIGPSTASMYECVKSWQGVLQGDPLPEKPAEPSADADSVKLMAGLVSAICGQGEYRLSFQQRLQLFARVSPQTHPFGFPSQVWPLLVRHGVFTEEELTNNATAVIECANVLSPTRHFEYYASFLREQGALAAAEQAFARQTELDAVLLDDPSITSDSFLSKLFSRTPGATAVNFKTIIFRNLLNHAECLVRLGKREEAKSLLARLDATHMEPLISERRDALRKLLE